MATDRSIYSDALMQWIELNSDRLEWSQHALGVWIDEYPLHKAYLQTYFNFEAPHA